MFFEQVIGIRLCGLLLHLVTYAYREDLAMLLCSTRNRRNMPLYEFQHGVYGYLQPCQFEGMPVSPAAVHCG